MADEAASIVGEALASISPPLPDLVVYGGDLPATVRALCRLVAERGDFFDRGGVAVRLVRPSEGGPSAARRLTAHSVTMAAHHLCRPVTIDGKGKAQGVTLPVRAALMTLEELIAGRYLPGLDGISTAPLLRDDGLILTVPGYDAARMIWCEPCPDILVPDRPTREDAEAALLVLRQRISTFPFADALTVTRDGVVMVDTAKAPHVMESMALAALLTAVCRPSLEKAPGLIVTAPSVTGAGTGKGLLVRAIAEIAFGNQPAAITAGHDRQELDKRIVAALIEASPVLFLDNLNGATLRSDTLASVMTERPARVRVMGVSQMVALNSSAFVAVTGNGLSVSGDLMRRFLMLELDARTEDPEARPFRSGFLADVRRDCPMLLASALTIWRWGRQTTVKAGLPLGSFETWTAWVRDPLLALGCRDPVDSIRAAKAEDPRRREVAELFEAWWAAHKDQAVKVGALADTVLRIVNPHNHGTRHVTTRLRQHVGTRAAGYVLTFVPGASAKLGGTYALKQASDLGSKPDTPFTPDAARDSPPDNAATGVNGVSGKAPDPDDWEIIL